MTIKTIRREELGSTSMELQNEMMERKRSKALSLETATAEVIDEKSVETTTIEHQSGDVGQGLDHGIVIEIELTGGDIDIDTTAQGHGQKTVDAGEEAEITEQAMTERDDEETTEKELQVVREITEDGIVEADLAHDRRTRNDIEGEIEVDNLNVC